MTLGYVPTCSYLVCHGSKPIRLACLIHAASVHPELGSNSKLRQVWSVFLLTEKLASYLRTNLFPHCTSVMRTSLFYPKDKTKENVRSYFRDRLFCLADAYCYKNAISMPATCRLTCACRKNDIAHLATCTSHLVLGRTKMSLM